MGVEFYKGAGFVKKILIHVDKGLHVKLTRMAKRRGQSLQMTVRGMLEKGAK